MNTIFIIVNIVFKTKQKKNPSTHKGHIFSSAPVTACYSSMEWAQFSI